MSHFFYIHKAICGTPGVSKVGKAMTPYSAVRLRQRLMATKFSLDHLYFGNWRHIKQLEEDIKRQLSQLNVGGCARTELFKMATDDMRTYVNNYIAEHNLQVKEVVLNKPYSATNSSDCPLGIPSEKNCFEYLQDEVLREFGEDPQVTHFFSLFEEVDA